MYSPCRPSCAMVSSAALVSTSFLGQASRVYFCACSSWKLGGWYAEEFSMACSGNSWGYRLIGTTLLFVMALEYARCSSLLHLPRRRLWKLSSDYLRLFSDKGMHRQSQNADTQLAAHHQLLRRSEERRESTQLLKYSACGGRLALKWLFIDWYRVTCN